MLKLLPTYKFRTIIFMKDQEEITNPVSFIKEQISSAISLKGEYNAEQMKFVKNMVNPDLTDTELYLFLFYANQTKLNPFNKEIIAVVYGKSDPANRRVSTIITRDGKRVVASRTGELENVVTEAIYVKETPEGLAKCSFWEGGKLVGAISTVTRKGVSYRAEAPLAEYDSNKSVWASKKSTMIKKVAESQALSMAFPEILGGAYDEAEMPAPSPANEERSAPTLPDGSSKATDSSLASLRAMDKEFVYFNEVGELKNDLTKQEVADALAELLNKGGKHE